LFYLFDSFRYPPLAAVFPRIFIAVSLPLVGVYWLKSFITKRQESDDQERDPLPPSEELKTGKSGFPPLLESLWKSRLLVLCAAVFLYLALVNVFGFFLSTFWLLFGLMVYLKVGWRNSLMISLLASLSFHLVFRSYVEIPLPRGWGEAAGSNAIRMITNIFYPAL